MEAFRLRLTHLLHCQGIGWKHIYTILKRDPELSSLYSAEFFQLVQDFPSTLLTSLHVDLNSDTILQQLYHYQTNGIHLISVFDHHYPTMLKETYQPPWILFAKGDISLLTKDPKLAVVGSRQASEYAKKAIIRLFPELIERGVIIVSGLATGVDTLAHETAMQLHGKTIAVIAGGLHQIYPRSNINLALTMMNHHLVLSEYPPDSYPSRWQFPMRNRIISGISKGTFIIEAKSKSGSLITANYAVHEGRDVFALPGDIFNSNSVGTNELIQQGAKLVLKSQDILEELFY